MSETNEFYLPEELLITYILTRLPIKSLLRFKSVSKRFHSIISSPFFIKLHLKKLTCSKNNNNNHLLINHKTCFLTFDFNSFGGGDNWDCSPFNDEGDIVINNESGLARVIDGNFQVPHSHIFVIGSCNGLVCLKTKFCFLYVWNPSTLECRKIPFLKQHKKQDVVWGFGCVTSGRDYIIVRICQNRNNNEKIIKVFSLLESCWTFSMEEMDGFGERPRLTGLGIFVNDVTYWLYKAYDEDIREIRWWIIGFDWITQKLRRVPPPAWRTGSFQRPPLMYVMEGRLCACWKINDSEVIEVGMLKEGSWMKLHQLSQNNVVRSLCYYHQGMPNITNKNRFAIKDGRNPDTLLLIDHAQGSSEDVHTLRIPSSRNVVNYTESLISPFLAVSKFHHEVDNDYIIQQQQQQL